ncbi:MAG: ligand-binding protein SH3 [Parcubacteria group bacterium]|nr:MAG: ligand-binding protein SH3 [Parcubacteria group bacterium]
MFNVDYAAIFNAFPDELVILLVSMIPIAELRVALPLALGTYHMPLTSALFWSFVGNMIPVFFILWFLAPVSEFLMKRSKAFERFFNWLFDRTRRKFEKNSQKFGVMIALMLFVAIPLPVTGAWTGSAAAFLFGVPFRKAIISISLGVIIAAVIVSCLYYGTVSIF